MKVVLFGASGMVGKGALLECLDSPLVERVLVVGRSSCGVTHPKLDEVLHRDFGDYSAIADRLSGFDACFFSGTDSSAKGRVMWARVKGETENKLLSMPFKAAYMFRPGIIQPSAAWRPKARVPGSCTPSSVRRSSRS